jgi:hypothetical protein
MVKKFLMIWKGMMSIAMLLKTDEWLRTDIRLTDKTSIEYS